MSKLIGTDGKPLLTMEQRVENLEGEVRSLKDALTLHGSFLMHLKKFLDILPTGSYKKDTHTDPVSTSTKPPSALTPSVKK